MKRKQIGLVPVKKPGKPETAGRQVAAQLWGKYLVLDLWKNGEWKCRHVTDTETGEYGSCRDGRWTVENLYNAFGNVWNRTDERTFPIAGEDRGLVLDALGIHWKCSNVYDRISSLEYSYGRDSRERREERRIQKINELMDSVPTVGKAVYDWIGEKAAGSLQYAFLLDRASGTYHCTACGGDFGGTAAGTRLKHRGKVECPLCGAVLTVEKRRNSVKAGTRLTLIHGLDEKRGIQRHFTVTVEWEFLRTVKPGVTTSTEDGRSATCTRRESGRDWKQRNTRSGQMFLHTWHPQESGPITIC